MNTLGNNETAQRRESRLSETERHPHEEIQQKFKTKIGHDNDESETMGLGIGKLRVLDDFCVYNYNDNN